MPQVEITVGGRSFEISCQHGEERFLHQAAELLNAEAQVLVDQLGRMPESRMLLMAGLMLADRTAALKEQVTRFSNDYADLLAKKSEIEKAAATPQQVEVPVPTIPESLLAALEELAENAEALAQDVETRAEQPARTTED